MMGPMSGIPERKDQHLELFRGDAPELAVESTLFGECHLEPEAFPQLAVSDLDTGCALLGRPLALPLLLTGMTGGTARAGELNRQLAALAAEHGLGLGLGSQRAMLDDPERAASYRVREELGPDALLLGNIGLGQLRGLELGRAVELVEAVGADALAVHLNVAQELVQTEGDRDFRGTEEALTRLCAELPVPVVVKEVGGGLSGATAARLVACGAALLDASGSGGTSWVEAEGRRGDARARRLATTFAGFGKPTAATLLGVAGCGAPVIASGGIRTGRATFAPASGRP